MTLLLGAATPSAIHQSSDFRLTDAKTGAATEECGAKQLTYSMQDWKAQVCFTGVAEASGKRTVDVLERVLSAEAPATIDQLARNCRDAAQAHIDALRGIPAHLTSLTVVIGAVRQGQDPELVVLSNVDSLLKPPSPQPLKQFEISWRTIDRPTHFFFGCVRAVRPEDERLLRYLFRDPTPSEIRLKLAEINARAAGQDPEGRKWISPACFVSSLLRSGEMQIVNIGSAEGTPPVFINGFNLSEFVRNNFQASPGKKLTLKQSAASGWSAGVPSPPPEGPVRTFRFAVPESVAALPDAKLALSASAGIVEIQKNNWVNVQFNSVLYSTSTAVDRVGKFEVPNLPTVDGAHPQKWTYLIETSNVGNDHVLTIAPSSMSFRNTNLAEPMPTLGQNEELVMVAPVDGLRIKMPRSTSVAAGVINARFLLRDFPELADQRKRETIKEWKQSTGRNDPCPCRSGKKFKKCCGA